MKRKQSEQQNQDKPGSMTSDKTNQDYNKRAPNLNDPNETKGKPAKILPVIGNGDNKTTTGQTLNTDTSNNKNEERNNGERKKAVVPGNKNTDRTKSKIV